MQHMCVIQLQETLKEKDKLEELNERFRCEKNILEADIQQLKYKNGEQSSS